MKRCWNEQELAEHWTLFEAEAHLLANRTDRCRIGVAVLLKYFQLNGRFPRQHRDLPGAVLAFLGEQLSVPPESWFDYDLWGRSGQRDRERIRGYLGFRPIEVADERRLRRWLETEVAPRDLEPAHLRIAVADWGFWPKPPKICSRTWSPRPFRERWPAQNWRYFRQLAVPRWLCCGLPPAFSGFRASHRCSKSRPRLGVRPRSSNADNTLFEPLTL